MTSARVAISLRHKGIKRVQVLEGGLNEWRRLNLPVTSELADPEEASARLGITVSPGFRMRLSRAHPTAQG
jgi:3-mercaptopyruvate sulfurtransferase SseA